MSAGKHTPGPWMVGVLHDQDRSDRITADDGTKYHRRREVARVSTVTAQRSMENETARADAALIAAAPDMEDALDLASAALNKCVRYLLGLGPQPDHEDLAPAELAIRAALKKARGE